MDDFDDDDAAFGEEDFKADSPSNPAFTMSDASPVDKRPSQIIEAPPPKEFKKNSIGAMAFSPKAANRPPIPAQTAPS